MSERADGLYWVVPIHYVKNPRNGWTVARWLGGEWDVLGDDDTWDDSCFYHIGPMVVESILRYRVVTKEEFAAGYVVDGKRLPFMVSYGGERVLACWPAEMNEPINQHGPAAGYR